MNKSCRPKATDPTPSNIHPSRPIAPRCRLARLGPPGPLSKADEDGDEATLGAGATVDPDLLVEIAIMASPLITGTLPGLNFPLCFENNCVALVFKKRTPKLVLEVPAGNWPDLAALGRSLGACTMQVRTPCD